MRAYERFIKYAVIDTQSCEDSKTVPSTEKQFRLAELLKKELGDAAMSHPARYALVEIVSLGDKSIEFEPIYRLVKDCDADALANAFKAHAGNGDGAFGRARRRNRPKRNRGVH